MQRKVSFNRMTEQQLDCALDLMRRLPPQQIEKNLSDLIDLVTNIFLKLIEQNKRSLLCLCQFVMFRKDDMFIVQVPELCEDLLSSVDQPLKIARDKTVGITLLTQ